jgi:hypothetical protein
MPILGIPELGLNESRYQPTDSRSHLTEPASLARGRSPVDIFLPYDEDAAPVWTVRSDGRRIGPRGCRDGSSARPREVVVGLGP